MLVSHRKRFIFVKTQKTAGTSVESFFEKYCCKDGAWTLEHYRDQEISEYGMIGGRGPGAKCDILHSHFSAEIIKSLVTPEIWESYFKFSIIRNPFDRLISRFFFNMKKEYLGYPKGVDSSTVIRDFRLFVRAREYPIINHLLIDGKQAMDFLIRYENLHQGIRAVMDEIDINDDLSHLPSFKSNFREPAFTPAMLYDSDTISVVEEKYQTELALFNYRFEQLIQ